MPQTLPAKYVEWLEQLPSTVDLTSMAVDSLDKSRIEKLEDWLSKFCALHGHPVRKAVFQFSKQTKCFSALGGVMFGLDRRFKTLSCISETCRQLLIFVGAIRNSEPTLEENILIEYHTFMCLESVFGIEVARRASSHIELFEKVKISELSGRFSGWIALAVLQRNGLMNNLSLLSAPTELIDQIKEQEIDFCEYLLLLPDLTHSLLAEVLPPHDHN